MPELGRAALLVALGFALYNDFFLRVFALPLLLLMRIGPLIAWRRATPRSLLVAHNRRRYGGYVVPAAVVLPAIGVAGSSAFQTVGERRVEPGGTLQVRDYEQTLRDVERRQGANAQEVRAVAVLILGSLVTLWPDAREQRRLAARYALPEGLARA